MTNDGGGTKSATRAHWAAQDAGVPRKVRSSSAALRDEARDRARLDVLCGRSLIARVVSTDAPRHFNVWSEVVQGWGRSTNIIDVETAPILIGCRCGATHELDPGRLAALAAGYQSGRPWEVPVSEVAVR